MPLPFKRELLRLSSFCLVSNFCGCGDFMAARLVKDPRTNRPKGYGFVEYSSDAEAEKAIKSMDGKVCAENWENDLFSSVLM